MSQYLSQRWGPVRHEAGTAMCEDIAGIPTCGPQPSHVRIFGSTHTSAHDFRARRSRAKGDGPRCLIGGQHLARVLVRSPLLHQ